MVLYVVDTLRADAIGPSGQAWARTPALDAFAREAVVFQQARAVSSWTRPSMASILTGAEPGAHRVETRHDALPEDLPSLASRLGSAGYTTAYFTANPNAGSFFGFGRDFDHVAELYARREAGTIDQSELITRDRDVVDRALAWMETAPRPFLLVVLCVDPHRPYRPSTPLAADAAQEIRRARAPAAARERGAPWPENWRRWRARYAGEVRDADAAFGRLVARLEFTEELDQSLVLFTSDHGEEFLEHGGIDHGRTLFDEVLRVPLVVRFPATASVAPGVRRDAVDSLDLVPTILDVLGLPKEDALPGRSLRGPAGEPRAFPVAARLAKEGQDLRSVVTPPWKLIRDGATGSDHLYRVDGAAPEPHPIALDRDPSVRAEVTRLRRHLDAWTAAETARSGAPAAPLSEEARAALEALGYAVPDEESEAETEAAPAR
ncbi:MAG: sulfatase [Myxococcota bacterium]